jgi:hypothetical protein
LRFSAAVAFSAKAEEGKLTRRGNRYRKFGEIAMKFGLRKLSLKKSVAARTSAKRMVKNALGLRAPPGFGWLTDSKKTA